MTLPVSAACPVPGSRLTAAEIRHRHAEMYLALRDEVASLRSTKGQAQLILPAGVLEVTRGPFSHYSFRLDAPAGFLRAGQDVLCEFDKTVLASTVIHLAGTALVLALPCSLGEHIEAGGLLSMNTTWLTEALQRRLKAGILSLTHGVPCVPPFNFENALRTIGDGTFRPRSRLPDLRVFIGGVNLNQGQRNAVRLAFGSDTCFLVGPPGTGKTTTLARIIEAAVRAGRSVCMLAPSNAAVDVLMNAVAERLRDVEGLRNDAVLRFGPGVTEKFRRAHGPQIVHDEVVARLREERYDRSLARIAATLEARSVALRELDDNLTACLTKGGPMPLPSFVDAIRARRERAAYRLQRTTAQRHAVLHASATLPRRLLDRAVVVGTTMHQPYIARDLQRQFDVVVIDEASLCQTAQVYVAAALSRQQVVVAGDYAQIPPVVAARTHRATTWLATDIFQTVGIPDDLERDDPPPYLAMLHEQHRMSPGICAVVNELFYHGRLKTARSVLARASLLPNPLGNTDVYSIDSSPRDPRVHVTAESSRVNPIHVEIVEDLLAELDSGGAVPAAGFRRVAIVSPYRGQVAALRRQLGTRYRGRGVEVTTAHLCQGSEADVVILDLTEAPGCPIGAFLAADSRRAAGPRLVNVAMSRARQQLYVLGAMEYLERAGGRVIRDLIRHLGDNAQQVSLRHIQGSAGKVYGVAATSPAQLTLHRGGMGLNHTHCEASAAPRRRRAW